MTTEKDQLIIDGLANFDLLELKEELTAKKVEATTESPEEVSIKTGKNFEFVSAAILVVNISIIAIKAISLWMKRKKRNDPFFKTTLRMKLSNGAVIDFNSFGQVKHINFPDGTDLEFNPKDTKGWDERMEKMDGFSEIVKTALEILKDV